MDSENNFHDFLPGESEGPPGTTVLPRTMRPLLSLAVPLDRPGKKSWKIQKAELAEMMTRRSLSWKLSKALERSGASDPRVTVALLNIWPKSAVDEETAAPRAPAIAFPLPCLAPAHSATLR